MILALKKLEDCDILLVDRWLQQAHIKKWYDIPGECTVDDWLDEIKARKDAFAFLNHFIVLNTDKPIGFCQYYKCADSPEEDWGALPLEGAYCIDYFIGEVGYLGKGFGTKTIQTLVDTIFSLADARCVVADVDKDNIASARALLSAGFKMYDAERFRYIHYGQ